MAALPITATVTPPGTGAQPVTFHGWTGYIPDLAEVVDGARRPGQDGMVAQGTGAISDPIECSAEKFYRLKADAIAFASTVRALQSPTPGKIVDPWARTLRIRIHRANATLEACAGPVDGTNQTRYRVACTLTVEMFPDDA